MSHSAKRQYLLAIIERYQKGGRKEKKFILDEFCAVCGYSRKYGKRLGRYFHKISLALAGGE